MLRFVFAMAAGFAAGYLYGSERAREEARQRFATAPEPLRRATQTVATAAGENVQRLAGAVATAPVPDAVKQVASRTGSRVESAAQNLGPLTGGPELARPSATEIATRPSEPLPRLEPESAAGS